MANINFSIDWLSSGGGEPAFRDTSAQLAIHLNETCLTRNEDIWSKTVRDTVLVSTYPLALWFASSWWRLNFEPLPQPGIRPSLDWRMAHELGAANHGFVWPRILFAPDGEMVNIWAERVPLEGQSIQYLYGLDAPRAVKMHDFQHQVHGFIETVLNRLQAVGCERTDLAALWSFVQEDRENPLSKRIRILEAQMGFDPDECPKEIISEALRIQDETGITAMSELAPIFGRRADGTALGEIANLALKDGLRGRPQVSGEDIKINPSSVAPWQRGVDAAREVRKLLNNKENPIDNNCLFELLGITAVQVDAWEGPFKNIVAVAKPEEGGNLNFIPRKKHPTAKRFEFVRFLADIMERPKDNRDWLVSSDIATARQKYQRAFAAEFLCPIDSLVDFIEGDYSESSFEDAAIHFGVSEKTVESLLANNGYLEISSGEPHMPYRLAA
ncbi:ImmA/IrrE family metallo-endopeptidase [Pollutimonas bauzanensis]|uniref:Uncharacterized protein n=1 Tax=Pollutimonas bauzanensis TaxID=658167 RepID=A0A1M5MRV5_9BURK|nr:hypothetical protein [Pollutimonas bauzanensis]SHG79523.1 hypothetical protein SAMN04488135_101290 [Pollutimonas bauzanensis]